MSNFVHLHRHGDFSLLDGIGKDEDYVRRAAELGQSALALTDHGSLAGVLYHAEACHEAGIKPIVGMEAYFRQDISLDRANKKTFGYFHLILLAKNQIGFRNLMRLSSASYQPDNFYQKPCIDWKLLRANSEGLIGSSSCVSGILPQMLLEKEEGDPRHTLRVFQDIFGEDFYLETQPHNFDDQRKVNIELINMGHNLGIPIVAAVDAHYPIKGWEDTQDVSLMIATGSSLKKRREDEEAGKDYLQFSGNTFWLMSEDEVVETYGQHHPDIPISTVKEMMKNSVEIADRCEDFNYDKSPKIPKATKSIEEAEGILRGWVEEGLLRIKKAEDEIYLARIEEELDVMRRLKVFDYFVIVGDMVRWAKQQGIRVGAARGSAGGCLVNYLIGITAIDPIGYGLIFERFLNDYRTEIPDIDIDFQDDRRDEVKQYLIEKWGSDYVVELAAFQSFGLKGVIKDVARVYDIPLNQVERATKKVPEKTFGMDLLDLEKAIPEIAKFFSDYPEVKKHSLRLQGQMKTLSRHAAAVIITDRPTADLIPMMKAKDGRMVTQWSERANAQLISPYGFLKIDCLSTDALTVQEKAVKLIKERHGIDVDFEDPEQFPVIYDPYAVDKEVINGFSEGNNLGIFQFSSVGISGLLKHIRPQNLEHVIAANALYRPGTLENNVAFEYAKRKNGIIKWKLPHEGLKKYLDYTFGFMVFQEQVMQIYKELAYDVQPAESNAFLKVVAKGIARDLHGKERLQKYYDKFSRGCREKGIPDKAFNQLWEQILQMTTYAFNKSHSSGYGIEAYQDMWLKKKYTIEFYTSLMTVDSDSSDKIPGIIKEAKLYGINVGPPDINKSDIGFNIDGNYIRFGLLAIKNVGPAAIREIIAKRPFDSFEDMIVKCEKGKLNKKTKLALLNAGAFDTWGGRDKWVMADDAMSRISAHIDDLEKAQLEKETIGFSLTGGDELDKHKDLILSTIDGDSSEFEDESEVAVGGSIIKFKEITTKKGEPMAFVDLDFYNRKYSLTLFPELYKRFRHMVVDGSVILALGTWDEERETVVVKNICTAEQLAKEKNKKNV